MLETSILLIGAKLNQLSPDFKMAGGQLQLLLLSTHGRMQAEHSTVRSFLHLHFSQAGIFSLQERQLPAVLLFSTQRYSFAGQGVH